MLKNRLYMAFALVAMVGAAACGGDAEEAELVEEPATQFEAPSEPMEIAPEVTEGAIIMDTSMVGTPAGPVVVDSAAR